MKRTLLVLLAFSIASGGALLAQTGKLVVGKGTKLTYGVDTKVEIVQSVGGQEMPMTTLVNGALDLAVRKMSARKIDWIYGIPRLQMSVRASAVPGGNRDTVVNGKMLNFSTDASGNINKAGKIGTDPAMSAIGGGLQRNSAGQLFSPTLSHALSAGDTWEEKHLDTVDNPALKGARMVVSQTLRYTYDGEVDTLGARALRVRSEVTSMSISGAMTHNGVKVKIDGEGKGEGRYYYSVADGLLVSSGLSSTINMRMAAVGHIVPVIYKASTMITRKEA